ncbi:2-aminoethylphosphonate--pyruvate transaminase [Lacticaseibacillus baoqingensis]|uniref:2-aminoethylphosphonate--pyruvate transaminase n=1 Tax=Lacticaseibacillus baoqingensis TaxID=2486013 RepID=A0ABW4EAV6_9LACO|nr:2-aminoethylphosphonate--pyruvate transaminase [Lacticaseibacillus baoqingensis]
MTPYLLLTPGPLTTTASVKAAMQNDYSTWDDDYNAITQHLRTGLLRLAQASPDNYASVLIQGSGSFAVEATLQTAIPKTNACVLVGVNGAYGRRIVEMLEYLDIDHIAVVGSETQPLALADLEKIAQTHPELTHFAMIHCETTTGVLNPIETIVPAMRAHGLVTIIDAMSSFAGIPIATEMLGIDYLISSANKCLQGVPGFGFVIAKRSTIAQTQGNARSLSLDLFEQLACMEVYNGKWRFTSPTHVVLAAAQALDELVEEGGVAARYRRFRACQHMLATGMQELAFERIVAPADQSPIITSFAYPSEDFDFPAFYQALKARGFVIYPGKVAKLPSFRIGNIGDLDTTDIRALLAAIRVVQAELAVTV